MESCILFPFVISSGNELCHSLSKLFFSFNSKCISALKSAYVNLLIQQIHSLYMQRQIYLLINKKVYSVCYCCITSTAESTCTEFCQASCMSRRSGDKFLVQGQSCSLDALVKSKTRQMSCTGVMAGRIYEPDRFTAWISDCLGLKGWQFTPKQNKQIKTCKSEHETVWNVVKPFVHDSDFREGFCFCISSGTTPPVSSSPALLY